MERNNKVSVVIPTQNRPKLILRAVRSALAQTYEEIEVIVVVDGLDSATSQALATIPDSRLHVIVLPDSRGAQIARNTGIAKANGDWIALLDDDDEWLPQKTMIQMKRALGSEFLYPIISCRLFCRARNYELVWPRRSPYEPLSEYLLARDSCSMGEGMLNTITLLFPKDLVEQQPFTPMLARCHEIDWVLRALNREHTGIEFITEPLAIMHAAEERVSITSVPDWRASLAWVESVREMITARAYASYLSITVASQAARKHDWKAFSLLLTRIFFRGRPKLRDIAFFMGVWCVPRKIQLAVRRAGW